MNGMIAESYRADIGREAVNQRTAEGLIIVLVLRPEGWHYCILRSKDGVRLARARCSGDLNDCKLEAVTTALAYLEDTTRDPMDLCDRIRWVPNRAQE
jgi:hypothetical protein